MHLNEGIQKILEIFPKATMGDDNYGQLIIYTDMKVVGNSPNETLVPFEETNEEKLIEEVKKKLEWLPRPTTKEDNEI